MIDEMAEWLKARELTTQQLNEIVSKTPEQRTENEHDIANDYYLFWEYLNTKQAIKEAESVKADAENLKEANDELQKALSELDSWLEERGI